jgi:hypothetical protein
MVKAQAAAAQGRQNEPQVVVVVNWLEELRRHAQFSK